MCPFLTSPRLTMLRPRHLPKQKRKDFAKYADIAPEEWLGGKVVSIMNYGAFVRLEGGVDGMVHISQMGNQGQRIDSVYNTVEVRWVLVCFFVVSHVSIWR